MKCSIVPAHRKQAASLRSTGLMLTMLRQWLILALASLTVNAQVSDDPNNSSASGSASSSSDWTQFHRNNMQRWDPYETVIGVNNANKLEPKWKYIGQPTSPYEYPCTGVGSLPPSPALADGVVYYGSADANLYALNASNGHKLWSLPVACLNTAPAVADGMLYFGSSDSRLHAVNAKTGAELWDYTAGGEVHSSPAVVDGVVYSGSDDRNLYAVNAKTGARLWSYTAGGAIDSSPAVAEGLVYFGSSDFKVYGLDVRTGSKLWSFETGRVVQSSPAVADGVVYVGSDDQNVYALDAKHGTLLWKYETGVPEACCSPVQSSPAVANGMVYVTAENGTLYTLNAKTGALVWSYPVTPVEISASSSSVAAANGVVYVGSSQGHDYALNARTGALLWDYTIPTSGFAPNTEALTNVSPVVANGVVYIVHSYLNGDQGAVWDGMYAFSATGPADLFLRVKPSSAAVRQGDLLTYTLPVWNLGPGNAAYEVLTMQVPDGTTFDYIRISGTPELGTCLTPPYGGTGLITCSENSSMAPNTTWTVRLTVKVTAPSGTVITESAATMADTTDLNMANITATVSLTVQ